MFPSVTVHGVSASRLTRGTATDEFRVGLQWRRVVTVVGINEGERGEARLRAR